MNSVRLDFGTYTPTLTNSANLDATTASASQWFRVGDVVTVSGVLSADATADATTTTIGISLPVPSNLSATSQLGGAGAQDGADAAAVIYADATNNRATFQYISNGTGNAVWSYSFTYLVIE